MTEGDKKDEVMAGWLITPDRPDWTVFVKVTDGRAVREHIEGLEEKADGDRKPCMGEEGYLDLAVFERIYSGCKRAIDCFYRR